MPMSEDVKERPMPLNPDVASFGCQVSPSWSAMTKNGVHGMRTHALKNRHRIHGARLREEHRGVRQSGSAGDDLLRDLVEHSAYDPRHGRAHAPSDRAASGAPARPSRRTDTEPDCYLASVAASP